MDYDQRKSASWLRSITVTLPEIDQILTKVTSDILVIGAGVFDLYNTQNWTSELKRKTGDIDFSVGLVSGQEDYDLLKKELIKNKYKNRTYPYRFFTPKEIPGAITYIDLLAHSDQDDVSDQQVRAAMGVGADFSLEAMDFAKIERFQVTENIYFPNPIAQTALKMTSYQDNPSKRVKDLADIAELAWGLVEKGTHFKMGALWKSIHQHPKAKQVKKMLNDFASGESTVWDLESARQELSSRNFSSEDIDSVIPERLKDWASFLE